MRRRHFLRRAALPFLLGASLAVRDIGAQTAAARAEPGSELTVYLMTMGPGDQVWERFGHNAIWISDRARGTDIAYNWGLFDFGGADFIPRLARGEMLYWMDGFDTRAMLEEYVRNNRSVWAQELNLTPAQRLRVRELAEINARPENREYIYDYYRDNCSTRARDLIDGVIGGAIRASTASRMTASSYRSHTGRLLAGDAASYTGAMLALGHPSDVPLSRYEEMFLPMKLREHIREVTVRGPNGPAPLVRSERQVFTATRSAEPKDAPNYVPWYIVAGMAIGGLLAGLAASADRARSLRRRLFLVTATIWSLVAGLAGVGLTLAWTATDHVFMYENENLLQFNPLPLVTIALLAAFAFTGRGGAALRNLAFAIAGISVLGFLLQALPGLDQANGELVALALPAHAALAWGMAKLSRPLSPRT